MSSDLFPSASDSPDPSLQIEQETRGDRNQIIGQAIDSTIVNFAGEGQVISLTIHERVPEASAPPPVMTVQPLTQQEFRQRQVLLNKVKDYWIKGVLETSLHARVLIELGLQERLDLVQRSFSAVAEFTEAGGKVLPNGTSATNVFDQEGVGRTLLILGEPGSGKTITLLKLAEDLITRTESDLRQPIPVVLNLSSWARKPQTIEQWLVQELLEKYQVSKSLGKSWVESEALILLLDGLDEVRAAQRNACVQALNQFTQTHGTTEITICCRIQDYLALTDRLKLRSAVCIQPLTPEQIDQYFERAGEQLSALKTVLRQNEELQGLATSPLMLSIMSLAYQGCAMEEVAQGGTTEEYRQRLFDTYVDRMFQRRGNTQQYTRQQTDRWLMWLAQRMKAAAQTVFLIERLQPSWLPTRGQRILYRLESSLISGLIVGLFSSLSHGLFGVSNFGESYELSHKLVDGLIDRQHFDLIAGLIDRLDVGLIDGLTVGLISIFLRDIQPVETLKWSWQEAKKSSSVGLRVGLRVGLIFGLVAVLFEWLFRELFGFFGGLFYWLLLGFWDGLFGGLSFGFFGGLIGELIGGFRGSEIQQKGEPNQGIHQSAWNAAILGIISWLISGLIYGLVEGLSGGPFDWLNGALLGGLIGWLIGGGSAWIRHYALRFQLYCMGYSPWNYARFLDNAAERLFLQKVGGGYIFMHRMLLEHFAGMTLD